ncbi:hypothetical protein DPMN_039795 [Dreissena polymorpha]|uniref:Uncharacterized protein n=1 Tax=Dreissena polymorpha TaxID=45954 RepID=A0A9D4CWJ3_DREPO|nr:hypothetical protein DPMN_039795 [Dreissena polymorpha]
MGTCVKCHLRLTCAVREIIKDDSVRLTSSIEELRDFYSVFAAELNYQKIPYVALYDIDRNVSIERVLNELKNFQTSQTGALLAK